MGGKFALQTPCVCFSSAACVSCLQINTDLLDKPSMWVIGGDGWAYDVSVIVCKAQMRFPLRGCPLGPATYLANAFGIW